MVMTLKKTERNDPMHYELAEWLLKQGQDAIEQEVLINRIKKIKMDRGFFNPKIGITYAEYGQFIRNCREYLELKYKKTLVNIRIQGERNGAYKIGNDYEATLYGVKQYKRFMVQADRVRRITPLMKREHIWPSVKKVFGEAQEEADRFKQLGQKFILAYDTDYKEVKQLEKAK